MATITIIGAGNVGHHLAIQLHHTGHTINQVYSRTIEKAAILAHKTEAEPIANIEDLSPNTDIYILAVKDDALQEVANLISQQGIGTSIIAHTSGSVPSNIFEGKFDYYGIFYPLQTFSKQKAVDFSALPFCIYGNEAMIEDQLFKLAKSICPNVYLIDDQQRATLHVAAVMVNNFSNFLYGMADEICKDHQVPFDILKPLIQETVHKVLEHSPKTVQTGPAIRGDQQTINKHLNFLEDYPHYQEIYKKISNEISKWNSLELI